MVSVLDRQAVLAELDATDDDHFRERRDELVAWVRGLQQASTREDLMRLQLELRDRFAARQDAMAIRREQAAHDRSALHRLAPQRPQPRDRVVELQRRIAIRDRLHRRDGVLQHIARCLADGLAWRATGCDRALFAVLGDGERVGRLPDELGAVAERARAQELWDHGALPLFNDLTNCLRHGDLTVLAGVAPRVRVAVEEVKRDGRPRADTQALRLDEKLRFLNDEWDATHGAPRALWRLPVRHRHRLDALAAVLAAARRDGCADEQIDSAIVVSATDLAWAFRHREHVGDWSFRAAEARGWTRDARHVASSSLVTRMRERRRAGSAYLAPLAIFPLCAEDVTDILMGSIDVNVVLRLDALRPAFAARGIEVEIATGRDAASVFLRARRGGDDVPVPAHLREQMLRELTTVATLVDMVETLLDGLRHGAPPDVERLLICDERGAWPRAPRYLAA